MSNHFSPSRIIIALCFSPDLRPDLEYPLERQHARLTRSGENSFSHYTRKPSEKTFTTPAGGMEEKPKGEEPEISEAGCQAMYRKYL